MSFQFSVDYKTPLLNVENLSVDFEQNNRINNAVDSVYLQVHAGETVAIVGESGSGKSATSLAIMGLIRKPGILRSGKVKLKGLDLHAMTSRQRRRYLGKDISMIFQEPTVSLNPSLTISQQISETLKCHGKMTRAQRRSRVLELIREVGIVDPERCLQSWPHQLSGGMNQRVMIAMAISCDPSLLIADEPTTALDVTVQAQILNLLRRLQQKNNMGMIFVTHDLSLVSSIAHKVVVMYAGQVVERCSVNDLFQCPRHPYTEALLKSLPANYSRKNKRLSCIQGSPPAAGKSLPGCRFFSRCNYAEDDCRHNTPELINDPDSSLRAVRCFYPLRKSSASTAGHV
jgi:oligopeptide/dipeptide ABC transporter ATP-binding protein